jgi:KipI family sensor histidine kinase inhibitor
MQILPTAASAPDVSTSSACDRPPTAEIRIHAAGCGGLLFNPGDRCFDMRLQQKLWALKDLLIEGSVVKSVSQAVLGVNNLLVLFDPFGPAPEDVRDALLALWPSILPKVPDGEEFVIPVEYGGPGGEDLFPICANLGMEVEQFVALHSGAHYTVACLGSMAGFAFMAGLPPQLATPRRQTPRLKVIKGSVTIGGSQAGVQSITAPSGWHLLGTTKVDLFDPHAARPCLLQAGDRVRFEMKAILK